MTLGHEAATPAETIVVRGAAEHNLKGIDIGIERRAITVITGVSGSGKSSLAFDTVLAEAQRRFFYTLSHYSRQFLDLTARPAVKQLTGLSPAIALAQSETQPSRRATVGTLTDLSELLGVMAARFGETRCPTHDLPTGAELPAETVDRLLSRFPGGQIAIAAPIAEGKKGVFKAQLTQAAKKGYLRAFIDGRVVALTPTPVLAKDEKHTIKIIIDYVKVKPEARPRLLRAAEAALAEGDGFGEYFPSDAKAEIDLASGGRFSAKGGCPVCGFSWPRLDSRHFSINSLGRCPDCAGLGIPIPSLFEGAAFADDDADQDDAEDAGEGERPCPSCAGTGLDPKTDGIRLSGLTPRALHAMPLADLVTQLEGMRRGKAGLNPAFARVAAEMEAAAQRIVAIGLGYLSLSRRIRSLSGGESQRLKLAGVLAAHLRGVLYVLDEPSQGLHPTELDVIWTALANLKAQGNTIIVVDHDEHFMRRADWIADLGPGGGARGGRLMAKFKPSEAAHFVRESKTARFLVEGEAKRAALTAAAGPPANAAMMTVEGARLHNLVVPKVKIPLAAWTVVAGVSGAGKSSLVLGTIAATLVPALKARGARPPRPAPLIPRALKAPMRGAKAEKAAADARQADATAAAKALRDETIPGVNCDALTGVASLTQIEVIDRKPVAKSSVSMPASYLDVMGELREIYAALPDAQVMGLTAADFSLSREGGRCPECKGRGELNLTMRFLADARVRCPVCKGARYRSNVLAVRMTLNGQKLSMGDVMGLTLDEAVVAFKNHRRIVQRLEPAVELGLGYLKMGQTSASLSGGEAQRLKLVPYLGKRFSAGQTLILDEPTTGLHFEDVERLIAVLRKLVQTGVTIIMIEHNADVIAAADWIVELGPGAAKDGGRLLYVGPPSGLTTCKQSVIAPYLT